jgi:Glycosyltransferase family 87
MLTSAGVAQERPVKERSPAIPYYVRALAMSLPAIMLGLQISGWIGFVSIVRDGHADFRANYTAGYMVRTGEMHQIYNYDAVKAAQDRLVSREPVPLPFIHPAYEALLYVPLSFLSFRRAYCVFLFLNLLLLLSCYRLMRAEIYQLGTIWKPLPMVIFLTFLPVAAALMQGQDSILLLALFVCAWRLMKQGDDLFAGLTLGLAVFRFQFVLPVWLLFLLWGKWRIIAGTALSGAICSLVSIGLVGFGNTKSYLQALASMCVGGVPHPESVRYDQPVATMASLRALVTELVSGWMPKGYVQIAVLVLSIAVLLWAAWSGSRWTRNSDLLLLTVSTSAVLGYHVLPHDLAILLLPLAVWLARSVRAPENRYGQWLVAGCTVIFSAPLVLVLPATYFYWASIPVIIFLWTQTRFQAGQEKRGENGAQAGLGSDSAALSL